MEATSPVEMVGVVPGSPAASLFHEGDVITGLVGATASKNQGLLGPALIDQIALLEAGATASFRVQGSSRTRTVAVERSLRLRDLDSTPTARVGRRPLCSMRTGKSTAG